jgi:hypothetical protein
MPRNWRGSLCRDLDLCAARAEQQPKYEADHGQYQNQQYPQHLFPGGGAALHDIDDGPDVGCKDQQADDAAEFDTHGISLSFLLSLVFGNRDTDRFLCSATAPVVL